MSVTLPKFGLKAVNETTRFKDLGKEMREMGQSIESILEGFDYNGADPNLVLARTAALEEAFAANGKTPWVALSSLVTAANGFGLGSLYLRRDYDAVELRGHITNGNAYTTWTNVASTNLPDLFKPSQSAVLGPMQNANVARAIEIATTGSLRGYSSVASGAWWSLMGLRYYAANPIS